MSRSRSAQPAPEEQTSLWQGLLKLQDPHTYFQEVASYVPLVRQVWEVATERHTSGSHGGFPEGACTGRADKGVQLEVWSQGALCEWEAHSSCMSSQGEEKPAPPLCTILACVPPDVTAHWAGSFSGRNTWNSPVFSRTWNAERKLRLLRLPDKHLR